MYFSVILGGGWYPRGYQDGLLEANKADDESYGMDFGVCEFEGVVLWVIGNDEDMLLVRSGLYALDNRTLCRVEDIGFIPLEE